MKIFLVMWTNLMTNGRYLGSFGCSEIGPAHIKNNTNNQDSWRIEYFSWGEVIAVSDGVGSKSLSELGSEAACNAAIQLAVYWNENPRYQAERLAEKFHEYWVSELNEETLEQCSCTALYVIRCGDKVLMAQLGDGLLSYITKAGDVGFLKKCIDDDNFSNQTSALQRSHSEISWVYRIDDADQYQAFLLMTDGISDDLLEGNEADFVKGVVDHYTHINKAQACSEIMQWLKCWPVPKHQDDKTIACIHTLKEE